jgi:protein gp37
MSKIEWTDETWNPLVGCKEVSPGCLHCYAAVMANRLAGMAEADIAAGRNPGRKRHYMGLTGTATKGDASRVVWSGKVNLVPEALAEPLGWKKPRQVFVNSMSDLFHQDVPDSYIAAVFGVMAASPRHTFQVLTKRPERMQQWMAAMTEAGGIGKYIRSESGRNAIRGHFDSVIVQENVNGDLYRAINDPWMQVMNGAACNYGEAPLSNVWLGTSVENQEQADKRIQYLLKTPAAVRFLSCEPLLGPIDVESHLLRNLLHWVICGGESGHGARHCNVEWIRSIVAQCKAAEVACFVKQLGANAIDSSLKDVWCNGEHHYTRPAHDPDGVLAEAAKRPGYSVTPHKLSRLLTDKKGGDWNEWPADLRVREFPRITK